MSSLSGKVEGGLGFTNPDNDRGVGLMEMDPCNFDDLYTSISETEIPLFSENDPTMESLITLGGGLADEAPLKDCPEMSLARKLWYTARSLSWMKEKARVKQEANRSMEKKIRDLSRSREKWKQRALQAEKQVKVHAELDQAFGTEPSLKQTVIFIHD